MLSKVVEHATTCITSGLKTYRKQRGSIQQFERLGSHVINHGRLVEGLKFPVSDKFQEQRRTW